MNLSPRRPIFNRRAESSVYRMFFWAILALGGIWLIIQMRQGDIKSPFEATATPTRNSNSFALEGDAQFTAGSLDKAIAAYQEAVRVDPNNAEFWGNLARVQTYSTTLLTIDADKETRLLAALQSSTQAVTLAPDDSTAHAVHAFVLDWNANSSLVDNNQVQNYLVQADEEAVRALQLDGTNTLALAYYAEILVDEQKWTQAQGNIQQAVDRDPSLMDVHRVYGYVLESLGQYNLAIQEYDKAIAIAPNLTFLYMAAGANYRQLGFRSPNSETQKQLYDSSLVYFAKAASINDQLGVKDPVPYLSIAKTYSQEGEFFIAARNVQKALQFKPDNADIYGQLGIIYFKSRNYEGSIPALQCAVTGCSGEASCLGRGLSACDTLDPPIVVNSLPLSPNTIDYYQVYFSVLAALGLRDPTYCPIAMSVADQVQTSGLLSARPEIASNIAVAQQECSSSAETATPLPLSAGSLYIATSTAFPTLTPSSGSGP
jgi:tetratricopeptide (TPR) repeat protein